MNALGDEKTVAVKRAFTRGVKSAIDFARDTRESKKTWMQQQDEKLSELTVRVNKIIEKNKFCMPPTVETV